MTARDPIKRGMRRDERYAVVVCLVAMAALLAIVVGAAGSAP